MAGKRSLGLTSAARRPDQLPQGSWSKPHVERREASAFRKTRARFASVTTSVRLAALRFPAFAAGAATHVGFTRYAPQRAAKAQSARHQSG
jgi:hypothetical protein